MVAGRVPTEILKRWRSLILHWTNATSDAFAPSLVLIKAERKLQKY